MDDTDPNLQFYSGLKALAAAAFPKRCRNCGKVYATVQHFLDESNAVRPHSTGLKQSYDEHDVPLVELYRNCPCGSTLMDVFANRRDASPAGAQRRQLFDTSVNYLVQRGVSAQQARQCLLRLLRGEANAADMALLLREKLS